MNMLSQLINDLLKVGDKRDAKNYTHYSIEELTDKERMCYLKN